MAVIEHEANNENVIIVGGGITFSLVVEKIKRENAV